MPPFESQRNTSSGMGPNRRGKSRVRKILGPVFEMTVQEGGSVRSALARLIDYHEGGAGFSCNTAISPGSVVSFEDESKQPRTGKVNWCHRAAAGDYRFGVTFEPRPQAAPEDLSAEDMSEPDYYELLQVNPKADVETIHRVYRFQAQRFHPDNKDTGDQATFKLLTKAYQILSEPESRAAYDLKLNGIQQKRWKIFDQPAQAVGVEAEKRKRAGILGILYAKRIQNATAHQVSARDLEELLLVPREHLEFGLWYLCESGMLVKMDNSKYAITVKGVDEVEKRPEVTRVAREDRLLAS